MFSYLIWVQIQKKFHLLNNLYILIWDRLYFWYKVVFPLSAEQKYFGLLVNHAHLVVCCIIVQGIHFVLQRVSVSRQSHLAPSPVGHRSLEVWSGVWPDPGRPSGCRRPPILPCLCQWASCVFLELSTAPDACLAGSGSGPVEEQQKEKETEGRRASAEGWNILLKILLLCIKAWLFFSPDITHRLSTVFNPVCHMSHVTCQVSGVT